MTFRLVLTTTYSGRFTDQVKDLLAKGSKVYRMYVNGSNYVRCHACPASFPPPLKEVGHEETWGECPGCRTQFIFQHVEKE